MVSEIQRQPMVDIACSCDRSHFISGAAVAQYPCYELCIPCFWYCFAMINSVFEEAYWRGFLLDETSHIPRVTE